MGLSERFRSRLGGGSFLRIDRRWVVGDAGVIGEAGEGC